MKRLMNLLVGLGLLAGVYLGVRVLALNWKLAEIRAEVVQLREVLYGPVLDQRAAMWAERDASGFTAPGPAPLRARGQDIGTP